MPRRKKSENLAQALVKGDSQQSQQAFSKEDNSHLSLQNLQNLQEHTPDQIDRIAMDNQSSLFSHGQGTEFASQLRTQALKKSENSPYGFQAYAQPNLASSKQTRIKELNCRKGEDQRSVERYHFGQFEGISKKKGSVTEATEIINLEGEWSQSAEKGSRQVKQHTSSEELNLELIRREIKREQKLDFERMKREKQELKELLQLEPRRLQTRKLQKRQKVVSKRTLELLAKKFDEYYAYENNFEYKGPKISILEIGQIFDIGSNTIHKLYTEWMDDPTFYDRLIRYDLRKRTPQKKLTVERLEHVARLIKENPFMTQNQLCVELNKIEDLKSLKDGQRQEINKTTVARLLKAGKFRKKRVRCVPKQRNTSKSLQKRYQFCAKYKQLLDKQAKIYFLDESGFNLYMTRQKAWARPNQEITVNCPISKGKRFSLIAIIGEQGLANWRIIEGTYRKYEYLDFIKELFEKLYEIKEDQEREKWLIMDNCAIHDKEETMKLAEKWNVKVMYLPAYSPQLNPIEMWFHEVKTKIRRINYSGERQLLEIMERTLKDYEDHDFSNYYHGSLKFIEKGLRKEKF